MTLRIGVDGYNLALPAGTGVASYGRALCRAITAIGGDIDLIYGITMRSDTPLHLRETLFYSRLGEQLALGERLKMTLKRRLVRATMLPTVRKPVEIPVSGRVIAGDFAERVPAARRIFTRSGLFDSSVRYFRRYGRPMRIEVPDPPAVMHWTYPVPVEMVGAKNVYTLHDIVPLVMPYASLEDKAYYKSLLQWLLDHADGLCTVSEASRRDIIEMFGVPEARIDNLYQAADLGDHAVMAADEDLRLWLDRLFDLDLHGYFLFAGAIEPKKNVGRLIEAYLQSGVETPLVIVGREGWRAEPELRLLRGGNGAQLKAAARIRRIDYLPRAQLLRLMRGARAMLFPSLYEGFGLPVLEAMALGAPVLTSNTSSLPEITGDAALHVDPYAVDDMASAIRLLDGDSALRKRLSALGLAQSERFSNAHFERRLAEFYGKTVG
ncbi:glycosyltransferase family 1 protein [Sphingobium sp. HBC34]|uniref:Glycosyltransferase family 1 protein n=1 Tax=Sphingobium cyanobacteriorum TaxID=3063954 RepID=A0ABT8ZNC3_9SPHN|nr:glycosyltransferase family 1 protein [Sphingobium sp. HBC34]MDO7836023.1 glycosyltransferase family 1 protein [Sphingobium sp. HBC34]